MTTVYFVRHAQPESRWEDDRTRPLTARGKSDREAVAEALRGVAVDAFISSPFERSYDTISLCAAEHGMEIAVDERLRERKVGAGARDSLEVRWADFDLHEEGGECLRSVQARNMAAVTEILAAHEGQTLVVGTHGTALSTILHHYNPSFGCDGFKRIWYSLPYIIRFDFEGAKLLGTKEILKLDRGYPAVAAPKLIIISGSPCVGKTTAANALFESYENSAHCDGDWVWCVNPFSIEDPRLRNGDKNMSFVLSTYLNSRFDYVIFSSVAVMYESIREAILRDIMAKDYEIVAFTLTCSEETLAKRHTSRGDDGEVSFDWLRMTPYPGDHVIHTDRKTAAQIADEMKEIIDRRV